MSGRVEVSIHFPATRRLRAPSRVEMSDVATYEEVLRMLFEKAADGSVSALVCLERALRRAQDPKSDDNFDAELERMLWDAGD